MYTKGLLEEALGGQEGLLGIEIHEVREISCTKPGDNYMSIVSLMEFKGTLPGGTPYSGSVFVKRQPKSEEQRQIFQTQDAFDNEKVMLKDLIPSYDVTLPCPRCLLANGEVVIMEDLRAAGYSMASRQLGFDLNEAVCVLKALARIHVASYHALSIKKETFTSAISQLKAIGFMMETQKEITESSMRRAVLQLQGQGVEEAVSFLQSQVSRFSECLSSLRKPKDIKVLCHGDFWINNILIREGDDPVKIVDFQGCAVLSPAVDVWTFLYTSIQPSIMENSFPKLLQAYCRAFLEETSLQKVPSDHRLSSENLINELQYRELYGYLVGLLYIPALVMAEDNVPDLGKLPKDVFQNDSFMDQFMSPNIKARMLHLSKFAIVRGLFKTT